MSATPPPCATCKHPYGEHDGWHMLGVARKDWTPRWGEACGFSVDFHHTCSCRVYRPLAAKLREAGEG